MSDSLSTRIIIKLSQMVGCSNLAYRNEWTSNSDGVKAYLHHKWVKIYLNHYQDNS